MFIRKKKDIYRFEINRCSSLLLLNYFFLCCYYLKLFFVNYYIEIWFYKLFKIKGIFFVYLIFINIEFNYEFY